MPSAPLKRKQIATDSTERSSAKRPRAEPNSEAGESSQRPHSGDSVAALQARLDEMTDCCTKLEKDVRNKSEALQRANDRVQCCICRDVMSNPYTLECGHSACLKCLRNCFISSPERSRYPVYGNQEIDLTDDSDGEEGTGQSPLFLRPSHLRQRRFRSVVSFAKECPICKRNIKHRPIVNYTLRHVIDDIRPTPLPPKALMERDRKWARRRDVWRGIFPADPYADNHRREQRRAPTTAADNRTPTRDRNQTPPSVPLPAPFFPFQIRRNFNQHRTERRLHPYAAADADAVWLRRQRIHDTDRRIAVIGGPAPPLFTTSIPALVPSSSPSSSRNVLPLSSRRISAESQREPFVEGPGEFELGLGSGRIWYGTSFFPPVPRPPSLNGVENPPLEEVETPRALPPPLPQLEDLPSSESVPSQPDPPQPTIREILQILRPQLHPLSDANDSSPSTSNVEEPEVKETEEMPSDARSERETEVNQDHDEEDEDENFSLIHAMLHGESANTVSTGAERYPVYIEELELLAVERDGGEGVWLGADLED